MDENTALQASQEASHKEMQVLLARVRGLPRRRKTRGWLVSIGVFVAFVVVMIGLGEAGYLDTAWPAIAALTLTIGAGIGVQTAAERREMRTIERLAAYRDKRALGGLLTAAIYCNRRVRRVVYAALQELLSQIMEEDASLLDTSHREILNALLYEKSGELALAALFAIEQVGDGTALPYLTSMAAGKGIPGALRDRRGEVQARAGHAVETIRERIERHNRPNVLLRAAQMPDTPSEQLVRPILSQPDVKAEELLRPEAHGEADARQKEEKL